MGVLSPKLDFDEFLLMQLAGGTGVFECRQHPDSD